MISKSICLLMLITLPGFSASIEIVRLLPADTQPSITTEALIENMQRVQDFYGAEMARHKFGNKSFKFSDRVIEVKGALPAKHYTNNLIIDRELPRELQKGFEEKIVVVFIEGITRIGSAAMSAAICAAEHCRHTLYVPLKIPISIAPMTAHEIGHAFRLKHHLVKDLPDGAMIMYSNITINAKDKDNLERFALDFYEARWLNHHPQFNDQLAPDVFPVVEKLHIPRFTNFRKQARFRFDLKSDSDLYQAKIGTLSGDVQTLGWCELSGMQDTAEITIDTFLLKPMNRMTLNVINENGGIQYFDFNVRVPEEPDTPLLIKSSGSMLTNWAAVKIQ